MDPEPLSYSFGVSQMGGGASAHRPSARRHRDNQHGGSFLPGRVRCPGGRYSTERCAAASTSSGVNSTTVLSVTAPVELTVSATAVALSLSGRSTIT